MLTERVARMEPPEETQKSPAQTGTWRCDRHEEGPVVWEGTRYCWSCGEPGEPSYPPQIADGWDAEPGERWAW
jgi:hypothetical protein